MIAKRRKHSREDAATRQAGSSGQVAGVEETERLPVILVASSAAFVFVFSQVAALVFTGNARGFDEWLLLAFRVPGNTATPIGPAWLVDTARDFTALGSTGVVVFIVVLAALFLILTRKFSTAAYVIAAAALGTLLNNLLKVGFARPRPDIVAHSVEVQTASFPSGHSMMSAVVYLTLGMLLARSQADRRVKIFVITVSGLLTLLIGVSRVYLGVHWPTDVLAGWALGAGWALLCWLLMLRLQNRSQLESDR